MLPEFCDGGSGWAAGDGATVTHSGAAPDLPQLSRSGGGGDLGHLAGEGGEGRGRYGQTDDPDDPDDPHGQDRDRVKIIGGIRG